MYMCIYFHGEYNVEYGLSQGRPTLQYEINMHVYMHACMCMHDVAILNSTLPCWDWIQWVESHVACPSGSYWNCHHGYDSWKAKKIKQGKNSSQNVEL